MIQHVCVQCQEVMDVDKATITAAKVNGNGIWCDICREIEMARRTREVRRASASHA